MTLPDDLKDYRAPRPLTLAQRCGLACLAGLVTGALLCAIFQ